MHKTRIAYRVNMSIELNMLDFVKPLAAVLGLWLLEMVAFLLRSLQQASIDFVENATSTSRIFLTTSARANEFRGVQVAMRE